ncbi:MAG TPA: HEAT repeat domain-containing protein, partial [Cyclobacteriaceae bacterium]|nr:HEAT repeat domain-containing protein [Cyclobacteriaceae bacterium]
MRFLVSLFLSIIICACSVRNPPNKFSDPVLVKIYDLKDRRSTDSLLQYLNSENLTHRQEAVLAFASVQDSMASQALGNILLEDPDSRARTCAAFALGQTGGFQAVNALIPALEDSDREVVREVLEALGKTILKKDFGILTNYQSGDTLLQEGLAWACYRLALRGKADSTITNKVNGFLKPSFSFQTRLGAASYFARSSRLTGDFFHEDLLKAGQLDPRPEVRIMAVAGFRNLPLVKILPILKDLLKAEPDYRVRVSAIRACNGFSLTETQEIVFGGLNDSSEMVQVAASEVIRNWTDRNPLKRLDEDLKSAKSWRVRANLYGALLKSFPSDQVMEEIAATYAAAPVYFKSGLLSALGEAQGPQRKMAFEFLSKELQQEGQEKVLLTSSAAALTMLDKKSKDGLSKIEFLTVYKSAIAKGDAGVTGIVASALTDTSLHYRQQITDLQFLYSAKAKFVLPKDIESLEPLERAIAYLEGKEMPEQFKNEFNHPISWEKVKTIAADQRVELKTSRGVVVLRLLVEETPGSVANFINLTNSKYFDGKVFHRVVPNFVVQAGAA